MQANTYIIEDNFDFWNELHSNTSDNSVVESNEVCHITQEPLTNNHITLPCGHKFNYTPLCKEMVSMKYPQSKYSTNIKLKNRQTGCPYCRNIFDILLPYIPIYNLILPKYICSSTNCLEMHNCSYKLTSGENKGNMCDSKYAFETDKGIFCLKHYKISEKIKEEITFINEDAKKLYQHNTLQQLKTKLRALNLSITGRKHVLANRIVSNSV
jgi:hypothetical protein